MTIPEKTPQQDTVVFTYYPETGERITARIDEDVAVLTTESFTDNENKNIGQSIQIVFDRSEFTWLLRTLRQFDKLMPAD